MKDCIKDFGNGNGTIGGTSYHITKTSKKRQRQYSFGLVWAILANLQVAIANGFKFVERLDEVRQELFLPCSLVLSVVLSPRGTSTIASHLQRL